MKDFSLKQGQGLMATAAHLYPKFPSVLSPTPLPLSSPTPNRLACEQAFSRAAWGEGKASAARENQGTRVTQGNSAVGTVTKYPEFISL